MSRRGKLKLGAAAADAWRQLGPRQVASVVGVACTVAVVRAREKLRLPRLVSTTVALAAAPLLAWGFERSRPRDGLVWGAQMWSYKNAFEIPYDRGAGAPRPRPLRLPDRDRQAPW